ncbi:MAG: hypothetical protein WD512_18520 [Candidatus Paceibacterota bacterium]
MEEITIVISIIVLAVFLIAAIVGGIDYSIWNSKYAGKQVHCIEDSGAEFKAEIKQGLIYWLIYFDEEGNSLSFKGIDEALYKCRGMAIIK